MGLSVQIDAFSIDNQVVQSQINLSLLIKRSILSMTKEQGIAVIASGLMIIPTGNSQMQVTELSKIVKVFLN